MARQDLANARAHVIQAITFLKAADQEGTKGLIDALFAASKGLERTIERLAKSTARVSKLALLNERQRNAPRQDRKFHELDDLRDRQEARMQKTLLTNGANPPIETYVARIGRR